MNKEPLEDAVFPVDVERAGSALKSTKKDLLFIELGDLLCVNYVLQQRAMLVQPCMIIMLQLYKHEILYWAHGCGHQGVGKVLAGIQEKHT